MSLAYELSLKNEKRNYRATLPTLQTYQRNEFLNIAGNIIDNLLLHLVCKAYISLHISFFTRLGKLIHFLTINLLISFRIPSFLP